MLDMSVMKIAPGTTKIGWIGVMGSSMCGHLIDAGFSATAYTRTRGKAWHGPVGHGRPW
jgi:3-hydroxyisobutyrate dehydrogenase